MDDGLTGFEQAVAGALDALGTGLLGRPQEFVGAVADLHDPESAEVAVLYMHCSGELLRAGAGTADALEQAARRAELWLHDVRRVLAEDARSVAWGVARGVAAHLGVALPRETDGGGQTGWDDETSAVVERVRAVLADSGATEADVAGVLGAVRALPDGTQGRAALEAALGRRLAKLAAEREKAEAARRAEEERLRREREERERAEAARKQREERDRLLAEREARHKAQQAARQDVARKDAEHEKDDPKPKPKPGMGVVLAVVACVILAAVLYVGSQSGGSSGQGTITAPIVSASTKEDGVANEVDATTSNEKGEGEEKSSGKESANDQAESENEKSSDDNARRADALDYSWSKLKNISKEIAAAGSDEDGLEIAKSYGLVDSDGKLGGDTKTVILTDGTELCARIAGFRHDELASGGLAGITFEFADAKITHSMNDSDTNEGGWEASGMRSWLNKDFYAMLPKDLKSCIEPAIKWTNNVGNVDTNDTSMVTATSDGLWLLSDMEVYGEKDPSDRTHAAVFNAEGSQYQIYADNGVYGDFNDSCDFCAKPNGGRKFGGWWFRTSNFRNGWFVRAGSNGWWCGISSASDEDGVSPGFCF